MRGMQALNNRKIITNKQGYTTDQGYIIDALKAKDYAQAWELVKYIGYKTVPNPNERYMLFNDCVLRFNPYENNNFILFYRSQLKFRKFDQHSTFYVTQSPRIIRILKHEAISPSGDINKTRNLAAQLKNWE